MSKSRILITILSLSISFPAFAIDKGLLLVQNTAEKKMLKTEPQAPQTLQLDDLGFQTPDAKVKSENQAILEERAHKLKLHQKLGLLTLALVAATAATAEEGEPGKAAPSAHRNLGLAAGASYFTTAYFSLTAPETEAMEKGSSKGWNIKVHEAMAFIHFPAMVLLPIAGIQASNAYRDNKPLTGLAKHKKDLAGIALGSLAIAALSVSIDF